MSSSILYSAANGNCQDAPLSIQDRVTQFLNRTPAEQERDRVEWHAKEIERKIASTASHAQQYPKLYATHPTEMMARIAQWETLTLSEREQVMAEYTAWSGEWLRRGGPQKIGSADIWPAGPIDEIDDDVEPPMDEPEKAKPRQSRFRTRQQDKAAPPPVWLIPGLIEEGCDVALYAPSGFLKSFVALDIVFALATGTKALGGALPVNEPGPCIYYAGEGHSDVVKHRAPAWEIGHTLEPFSVDNVIFGNEAPYMNDRDGIEHDIADLTEWLDGRSAKLIVIDTLNRTLNGADEDRAHTAAMYLNSAKAIRERLGGSTLTVAHKSNKGDGDRGVRGSSAFEAGFDTVLEIKQHHKDELTKMHTICVMVKKQKSGEDGAHYYLQTRFIDNIADGSSNGASSLVLTTVSEEVGRAALEQKPDNKKVTADLVETVLLGLTDGGYTTKAKLTEVLAKRLNKGVEAIEKALERGIKTGELQKFVLGRGKWSLPEIIAANDAENQVDMSPTVDLVMN